MEEKAIVERCKIGEIEAYKILYTRYNRPLFHTAYRMLGNKEDAEDAVQTTFLKVYKSIQKFQYKSKFSTYLFRILMNTCIDIGKKKTKYKFQSMEKIEYKNFNNPDYEVKMEIDQALEKLPHKQRECFLLFTVADRKQKEIAEILDISIGGVKSNIFQAKSKLRSYLGKCKRSC